MTGAILLLVATASVASTDVVAAPGCPATERVLEAVQHLDVARGTRTARFGRPVPQALFRRAAARPGKVFTSRDGIHGAGVVLVERPVESIWPAVVDEDHHDADGDYIPVKSSERIRGTSSDSGRLLLQRVERWGFSRWWVIRVTSNAELFEASAGRLWEAWWEEAFDDPAAAARLQQKGEPLHSIHGSWLLMRIAPACTLVEYNSSTDPGGAAAVAQRLLLRRAIRDSLEGLLRFATEHVPLAHDDTEFSGPDGRPLNEARFAESRLMRPAISFAKPSAPVGPDPE